ncbi:metallophosphatase [Pontibacillus halophilus JSM 076056 = DSM 19796]|uniref:Phosphoesterase n=1 Tax=Pontibacillus halophilus JSM 076056 = DSM 19796 TaxID=1385510 RepID=A0A0A5GJM8_9BACI|nr:metallophosphoesterase [Pontibacillus halophilus]KGX93451.1 metallophosphatase [Pontibacillus halophilus JSM 076056 = DSM 19796]
MPKVLIVSDSHGLEEEVGVIRDRHKHEVDAIIHCGDSELPFDSVHMEMYAAVRGNCDMDDRYPDEETFSINDLSFFATHGHLFQVKSSLMPLSYRAEELGANVICFGHSHMAGAEMVNGKLFINPGSVRLPRGITEKTYAILQWEGQKAAVHFYSSEGNPLPNMTYETNFQAE